MSRRARDGTATETLSVPSIADDETETAPLGMSLKTVDHVFREPRRDR